MELKTTVKASMIEIGFSGTTKLENGWSFTWKATRRESGMLMLKLLSALAPGGLPYNLMSWTSEIVLQPSVNPLSLNLEGYFNEGDSRRALAEPVKILLVTIMNELVGAAIGVRNRLEHYGWIEEIADISNIRYAKVETGDGLPFVNVVALLNRRGILVVKHVPAGHNEQDKYVELRAVTGEVIDDAIVRFQTDRPGHLLITMLTDKPSQLD